MPLIIGSRWYIKKNQWGLGTPLQFCYFHWEEQMADVLLWYLVRSLWSLLLSSLAISNFSAMLTKTPVILLCLSIHHIPRRAFPGISRHSSFSSYRRSLFRICQRRRLHHPFQSLQFPVLPSLLIHREWSIGRAPGQNGAPGAPSEWSSCTETQERILASASSVRSIRSFVNP